MKRASQAVKQVWNDFEAVLGRSPAIFWSDGRNICKFKVIFQADKLTHCFYAVIIAGFAS
jgi:hypothetical protein